MGVLLYYPTVKPPTEIIYQSLLYWDGFASVVPREPSIYQTVAGPELRQLEERGLYRPLTFRRESLDSLVEPQHSWIAGGASSLLAEELRRIAARPNPPHPTSPPEAVLHFSKITYWLERLLLDLGLASGSGRWMSPLQVSKEVQMLVIGVMAREIAFRSGKSYIPYTDREDAFRNSLHPAVDADWRGHTANTLRAYEVELGRLLPVPSPGTPIADVLAFREKYTDERVRLMRALHRMLGNLRRDYENPGDVVSQLRVEFQEALKDYQAARTGSRMAWVQRSITVSVALAAAAGGASLPSNYGWFLGAISGYALNVATREIRPLSLARDNHDYSYLHRIGNELP